MTPERNERNDRKDPNMIRWIGGVLLVAILVLGFVAWRRSIAPAPAADAGMPAAQAPSAQEPANPAGGAGSPAPAEPAPTADAAAIAGIKWTVPAGWREGGARAMRLATFMVGGPAPETSAECAVFYFGPGLGGGVDENIQRWTGQFAPTPNSSRRELTVHGMKVTRVEIAGTYLAPGVDMKSQGELAAWKLLGAIVEGPKGAVFFKYTGPAGVIDRSADDFDGLLGSLEKR